MLCVLIRKFIRYQDFEIESVRLNQIQNSIAINDQG